MAPISYQKVPTQDHPLSPSQEPKEYNHSPEESGDPRPSGDRESTKRRLKRIHFVFIGLFILFYMTFFIARGFFNTHGISPSTRMKCHETMHRLGLAGHMHYNGTGIHRNISSLVNGKLPTHYTLPSGDKIPSVALGKRYSRQRLLLALRHIRFRRLAGRQRWSWWCSEGQNSHRSPNPKHFLSSWQTALKTGYRHIDGAWIYGVRFSSVFFWTFPARIWSYRILLEWSWSWSSYSRKRGTTHRYMAYLQVMEYIPWPQRRRTSAGWNSHQTRHRIFRPVSNPLVSPSLAHVDLVLTACSGP